ncbi:MAG: D-glycero-alpha-D-manno-heptose-1,7-bisphosphate 7-phosphatase [Bacteroidia bacterium]
MISKPLVIDKSWTLFLDRDGVINVKLEGDYVKKIEEFQFTENAVKAIAKAKRLFGKMLVVTNQQGIAKGLYTEEDLKAVHTFMQEQLAKENAQVDKIYFCPALNGDTRFNCRKPDIGMALQAQNDFPEIDFSKSVMVGDSLSDMEFGRKLGMYTVFIAEDKRRANKYHDLIDAHFTSLNNFILTL